MSFSGFRSSAVNRRRDLIALAAVGIVLGGFATSLAASFDDLHAALPTFAVPAIAADPAASTYEPATGYPTDSLDAALAGAK